jgi:SOS-response transcriptional repressor LexA
MPHALTERQKEYLAFLKEYIRQNEFTPKLEEIAAHFGVKSPTAHKTLKALELKGYLITRRTPDAGYFIRLAERSGGIEKLIDLQIIGKVNRYGVVSSFPRKHGSYPICLIGVDEMEVFGLRLTENIPQANLLEGDLLICDYGKRPLPGDIALIPLGLQARGFFLVMMHSLTHDRDMPNYEVSNEYPVPVDLINEELGQKLHWFPLAWSKENEDYFAKIEKKARVPSGPIPPELIAATVLRVVRSLSS